MKYAIPLYKEEKYRYDNDGNKEIDYVDDNGKVFYITTGEKETIYSEPIEFRANIAGKIKDSMAKEFGIGNNPNYASLVCNKGEYDLPVGAIIWKRSQPTYKEFNGELIVDSSSSDYDVVGRVDEFMGEDNFLLHKQQK